MISLPPAQCFVRQENYVDNNYVGSLDEEDTPEINSQPSPAFDDLRGIEFTSEPSLPAVYDPEPTTYRAPIDFELGTTAATGIEVEDILLDNVENQIYDDEYETEDETDYKPQSGDIPIDISGDDYDYEEDGLAGYDPVPVLLVGTPEKVRLTARKMSDCANNNSFKEKCLHYGAEFCTFHVGRGTMTDMATSSS